MDDSRIRDIFFGHLKDKDANEAIAETHREISESVLAQIYEGQTVDKPTWDLLIKIIKGVARVNLYSPYFEQPEAEMVSFGPQFFADIHYFVQTWRDAVSYIIEHFDELMSARVKATYSQGHLRMVLDGIDKRLAESAEAIAQNGFLVLGKDEFRVMSLGLFWSLRSVMGKDNYKKFADEFDRHLPHMKMCYLQIMTANQKPQ
jgi:hypothetical protein